MFINKEYLKNEIGTYKSYPQSTTLLSPIASDQAFVDALINKDGLALLYLGTTTEAVAPTTCRFDFIDFIACLKDNPSHRKYQPLVPDIRKTKPEEANITLSKFLGKKGLALYKKALEEEFNSKEYRNAVFRESTKHYDGIKWGERLVVHISGPSACGKSSAVKTVIEMMGTSDHVKKTSDNTGNDVVGIDNGIGRQVSQMRKLLIRVANIDGYTGLSDLDKHGSILTPLKTNIQKAVLLNPDLSLVIPDTYSDWILDRFFSQKKGRIKTIDKQCNTKQVFCRIEGEDTDTFKKVVGFMGNSRAWKTDFPEAEATTQLSMNDTDGLTESKPYDPEPFNRGVNGSKKAQEWFLKESKAGNFSITITNNMSVCVNTSTGLKSLVQSKKPSPPQTTFFSSKPSYSGSVSRQYKAEIMKGRTGLVQYDSNEAINMAPCIAMHARIRAPAIPSNIDAFIIRFKTRTHSIKGRRFVIRPNTNNTACTILCNTNENERIPQLDLKVDFNGKVCAIGLPYNELTTQPLKDDYVEHIVNTFMDANPDKNVPVKIQSAANTELYNAFVTALKKNGYEPQAQETKRPYLNS